MNISLAILLWLEVHQGGREQVPEMFAPYLTLQNSFVCLDYDSSVEWAAPEQLKKVKVISRVEQFSSLYK